MPRSRFSNVPPDERPNWSRLNEGQRRYAWEQYNLALVRRGRPIDHPFPDTTGEADLDEIIGRDHPEADRVAAELDRDLGGRNEFEEALDQLPDAEEDAVQDFDESHFESPVERSRDQHRDAMADSTLTPSKPAGGKRSRLDFDQPSTSKLPGTGRAQGEGGNNLGEDSVRPFRLPKPIISIQNNVQYFRKVHRFFTYGFAYKVLKYNDDFNVMTTPLALVPWDFLHFYVNPSEFALLPNQASVQRVKCTVYQRNVRVAFPTNSTANALATLNQNKNIVYAIGLNKKCEIMPRKYTGFATNQPMIPTASSNWSQDDYINDMNNWYGSNANTVGTAPVVPRHQTGQPDVLQHYAHLIYHTRAGQQDGWECLQTFVEEGDADATSGGRLIEVNYSPKVGICKPPKKIVQRLNNIPVTISRGSHNLSDHDTRISINATGDVGTSTHALAQVDQNFAALNSPVQLLEKSQMYHEGAFMHDMPQVQPSLHIGVQPTYALTSTNTTVNNSFTDTQALFEIVAEAWIDTNSSTFRPLTQVSNVKIGNIWNHAAKSPRYDFGLIDGLYRNE